MSRASDYLTESGAIHVLKATSGKARHRERPQRARLRHGHVDKRQEHPTDDLRQTGVTGAHPRGQ